MEAGGEEAQCRHKRIYIYIYTQNCRPARRLSPKPSSAPSIDLIYIYLFRGLPFGQHLINVFVATVVASAWEAL